MATEDGGRSIAGISIPQWMKSKMDHSWDLEQNALSPPEADDSFLYIRYPRLSGKSNSGEPKLTDLIQIEAAKQTAAAAAAAVPDYTRHTDPCKQFIPNAKTESIAKQAKETPIRIKSNGTDDGFKGEGAACGNSIVKVAHQMVSGKVTRGFAPASATINRNSDDEASSEAQKGYDPTIRRGSKSLPASPLGSPHSSPKSNRRLQNKYFTGPFVDVEKHHGGSWILSGLLSKRDNHLSGSVNMIAEEEHHHQQNLSKAISNASISSTDDFSTSEKKKTNQVFKAKPSELREMNFWSPTSM